MSGDSLGEAVDSAVTHALGDGGAAASSSEPGTKPAGDGKPGKTTSTPAAKPAAEPAAGSGSEPQPSGKPASDSSTTRTGDPADPSVEGAEGAPPREQWSTILDNARTKERDKVTREYGGFTPQDVEEHLGLVARDPVEYWYRLGLNLQRRGLVAIPGGNAGGEGNKPPARTDVRPSMKSEDGTPAYSQADVDALLVNFKNDLLAELQPRLGPLEEGAKAAKVQARRAQARELARGQFEEATKWDKFEELRGEIAEEMEQTEGLTLVGAYNRVYQRAVIKERGSTEATLRQKILDELNATPDPNTVKPDPAAASRSGSRKRGKSLDADIDKAVDFALSGKGQ